MYFCRVDPSDTKNIRCPARHNNILFEEIEKQLKNIGVGKTEIEELRSRVKNDSNDKPALMFKVMKWMGSVSVSLTTKGYTNV